MVGLEHDGFSISIEGIAIGITAILLQLIFVFLNNGGLCYRNEIIDIIKIADKDVVPRYIPKKSIAICSLITAMLPVVALIMKFTGAEKSDYMVTMDFANYFSLFGLIGLGTYGIPYFIDKIIEKKFRYSKEILIILKNLKFLVSKSVPLYIGYVIIRFLSIMVIGTSESKSVYAIGTISLMMLTIIITVTLLYRIVFTAFRRRIAFKSMNFLGYKKESISKIIKSEMILYALIVVGLPLSQLIITIIVYGNWSNYSMFLTGYSLISILGTFISFIMYKKIIFDYIDNNYEREEVR